MALAINNKPSLHCVDMYFAVRTPGSDALSVTGFRPLPETAALSFEIPKETATFKSVQCATRGQTIASSSRIGDDGITATMTVRVANVAAMAAALSATQTTDATAGGSVAAESVDLPVDPGVYVKLAHARVSDVVITGSVLGTDYVINETLGMIATVAGGNLVAGGDTDVAYDYAAGSASGTTLEVGALINTEWALAGVLQEQFGSYDGKRIEIDAATVDAAEALKLTLESPEDEEPTQIVLSLKLRTLPGQSGPARIDGMPLM